MPHSLSPNLNCPLLAFTSATIHLALAGLMRKRSASINGLAGVQTGFPALRATLNRSWVMSWKSGAVGAIPTIGAPPLFSAHPESHMSLFTCTRKIDDNQVDDQLRSAIKSFCVKLVESVNKYYAFGSCFVDDST